MIALFFRNPAKFLSGSEEKNGWQQRGGYDNIFLSDITKI